MLNMHIITKWNIAGKYVCYLLTNCNKRFYDAREKASCEKLVSIFTRDSSYCCSAS